MSPSPATDRYEESLRFLYDRINYEKLVRGASRYPFRLQRITELLRALGLGDYLYDDTPQPRKPLVHIAGTKGKGSVAAMVAAALSCAGLRTGLYTSPHLHDLEERFRVDGQPCSQAQVISLVERIRSVTADVEQAAGAPSFFELTTAMALLHFDTSQCDAIVLEVGLGGRLDSTNVCTPSVSAVTSIGLDHQHVLGDTLPAIAKEKAGIIKPGVPVVSGVRRPGAAEVIANRASEQGCELFQFGSDFEITQEPLEGWGTRVRYAGRRKPLTKELEVSLAVEGQHQSKNAACAIAILDLLRDQGNDIPTNAISRAFSQLECPGRVERFDLPNDVMVIVDAAHNEDSIDALCQCLRARASDRPICVVFGTSVDKSAEPMLKLLAEVADRLLLTRFWGNPRFQPPEKLQPLVPIPLRDETEILQDPITACAAGLESVGRGGMLVVCGSFFLAAETRNWLKERAIQRPNVQ